jgi:hypothetical protein
MNRIPARLEQAVANRVDTGASHGRPLTWRIGMTAPVFERGLGPFLIQRSATFGILRIDRSRVSISYETTKARHTTNNAFTISQTSSHPIIPT